MTLLHSTPGSHPLLDISCLSAQPSVEGCDLSKRMRVDPWSLSVSRPTEAVVPSQGCACVRLYKLMLEGFEFWNAKNAL